MGIDNNAAAEKRKKLRDAILKGNTVIVNTGEVKALSEAKPRDIIKLFQKENLDIIGMKIMNHYWMQRWKLWKNTILSLNYPKMMMEDCIGLVS
jgi:hypothetical protein